MAPFLFSAGLWIFLSEDNHCNNPYLFSVTQSSTEKHRVPQRKTSVELCGTPSSAKATDGNAFD